MIILAVCAVLAQAQPESLRAYQAERRAMSGVDSLYIALDSLGLMTASFEDFKAGFGPIVAGVGQTLATLEGQARRYGAKGLVVRTTLEHLQARTEPLACIVHAPRGQFMLLYAVEDGVVRLVDYPDRIELDDFVFESRWTGDALLLSNQELLPEADLVARLRLRRVGIRITVGLAVGLPLLVVGWLIWRRFRDPGSVALSP